MWSWCRAGSSRQQKAKEAHCWKPEQHGWGARRARTNNMRSDGALEPRHGAATLQGRHIAVAKYRREARVKTCETQQQQCADEDDEAAAAATATATARDANNNSNNYRWATSEQQARPQSPSQAPGTTITTTTATIATANKANLHLSIKGVATAARTTGTGTRTGRPSAASPKMREKPSLMLMERRVAAGAGGSGAGKHSGHSMVRRLNTYILCLISFVALLPLPLPLPLVQADDGDNFFAVNSFSVGPETTTPEFGKLIPPERSKPYRATSHMPNR